MSLCVRHEPFHLFQVHDEFAGIVPQEFQSLYDGWSGVCEKVVEIAASQSSCSTVLQAVQSFHNETSEGST